MAIQQISAKVRSGDRAEEVFTINIDVAETLDEATQKYGEPIVFSYFNADFVIAAQSFMRGQIKKDNATNETVQAAMDAWKPGMKVRGKSAKEKVGTLLSKLTAEDREELIKELMEG